MLSLSRPRLKHSCELLSGGVNGFALALKAAELVDLVWREKWLRGDSPGGGGAGSEHGERNGSGGGRGRLIGTDTHGSHCGGSGGGWTCLGGGGPGGGCGWNIPVLCAAGCLIQSASRRGSSGCTSPRAMAVYIVRRPQRSSSFHMRRAAMSTQALGSCPSKCCTVSCTTCCSSTWCCPSCMCSCRCSAATCALRATCPSIDKPVWMLWDMPV
jgi:hypothetical protein